MGREVFGGPENRPDLVRRIKDYGLGVITSGYRDCAYIVCSDNWDDNPEKMDEDLDFLKSLGLVSRTSPDSE